MLREKRWYFSVERSDEHPSGFMRRQWVSWERAIDEATARGGFAEEEMIEVEETSTPGPLPEDSPVIIRVVTGRRAYKYADRGGEKPVREYLPGTVDYYEERAKQVDALSRVPIGRSR